MKSVPLLALLQKRCIPHRGIAGPDQPQISFPRYIGKIKFGDFILRAVNQGMLLTSYMLHTRIANWHFIWQSMEAAPMALQPVLTKSKPSQ